MRAQEAWRLPAAYRYSLDLDGQGRAWEFLRRNQQFRKEAGGLLAAAPGPSVPSRSPSNNESAAPARLRRMVRVDPLEPWGLHFRPEPCASG